MEVTADCDLRHMFGAVRDQGARPTCMAFAASDAHAAARPGWTELSCEYAYYHAVKRDGGKPDDGSTLSGMMAAIEKDGQPVETDWSYLAKVPSDLNQWRPPAKPDQVFKRAAERGRGAVPKLVDSLDNGTPVIVTMCLSDAFYLPDTDGVVDVNEPPDPHRRHAVVAVGHGMNGSKRLILIRNSWGPAWGMDGHAWLSEMYLAPRLSGIAEMREDLTDVRTDRSKTNMRRGVA